MRKILLLLALVPALAVGQTEKAADFRVTKAAPAVEQPVKTIDRVSKRTANSRTFELDSVGSGKYQTIISAERLNYQDSTGAWQKIDLTTKAAKTAGYAKRVDVGQSVFEYDSTGRVRYQKGEAWLELTPAFKDVGIEFNFEPTRLKANYYLDAKSPSRLAWGLKESTPGLAERKIEPFTAWDDSGRVVPVTVEIGPDSVLLTVDKSQAFGRVTVDPSINDTAIAVDTMSVLATDAGGTVADWMIARNKAVADLYQATNPISGCVGSGTMYAGRGFYKFAIPALGNGPDSARLYVTPGNILAPPDSLYIILGKWTGVAGKATFNDFVGWPDSSEYDGAIQPAPYLRLDTDSTSVSVLFSATGINALDSLESDTLRIIVMQASDYLNDTTAAKVNNGSIFYMDYTLPYLVIYYTEGNPPGLSAIAADTLTHVQHLLYAEIDSTGGYNLTVRGFQSFLYGDNTDTSVVSDTGDYGTGVFSHLSPLWLVDTSYVVRAFGINPSYTSYGPWDTLSTDLPASGASSVIVDGRTVNRAR